MTAQTYPAPESVSRFQQRALLVGVLGLAACAVGAFINPDQFFRSYLLGYLLALGVTLGCLGLVMLQHMTGGHWGIIIRRPLESATRTLPLLAVFFIPLLAGIRRLYVWTRPEKVTLSPFQKDYLTIPGYIARAVLYFAVWIVLMFLLNRWSQRQDTHAEDRTLQRKMRLLSAPGFILYVLTMTFAAVDWVMSLSPQWTSTIYGFLFVGGQAISAMSLMIIVVVVLARSEPMSRVLQPRHLHDLGKLLFAFLMLWAYFSVSQLIIIWSGNLPEEISFYRPRLNGSWGALAVILLVFHFALPFALLLLRDLKRSARYLSGLAAFMILMRAVDLFWMTGPNFWASPLHRSLWLDLAAFLGIGGIWLAWFSKQLKEWPLLPLGDPNLTEAIRHNEH